MAKTKFRDPVFVRNDDETEIAASVVEWGGSLDGFSIRLTSGEQSILILPEDWAAIKSSIDCELNRVGAFNQ